MGRRRACEERMKKERERERERERETLVSESAEAQKITGRQHRKKAI
jgi:hypothetical protein